MKQDLQHMLQHVFGILLDGTMWIGQWVLIFIGVAALVALIVFILFMAAVYCMNFYHWVRNRG